MILAIDIGNTSIHWGIFQNKILKKTGKILINSQDLDQLSAENYSHGQFEQVIVSCVVPALERSVLQLFPEALFVTSANIPAISISLESPEQVGADRLVDAMAVWKLFGGPAVIVDFGTATTFDLLSISGEYLGGAIAPGIDLSRQSLNERTAKLPLIEFFKPKQVIGKNTVEAMQSGLYFGYQGLVKELIHKYKEVLGHEAKVIATGGYAKLVCQEIVEVEIIDEYLALKGLMLIAEDRS